jgi:hypothetical protein
MITTEIIDHNLNIPEDIKEIVGDNQIQVKVFEDGVHINTVFLNSLKEVEDFKTQLSQSE